MFKVKYRVRCIKTEESWKDLIGRTGTVIGLYTISSFPVLVELDVPLDFGDGEKLYLAEFKEEEVEIV